MKICLLNESFPPVIDGVCNVLLNYARYLIMDHGAEIEVGTPEYPGADYSGYPYKVVAYPSLDTASMTNGYRTGIPFDRKSVADLAGFGSDILHCHGPASSMVVARLLREQTGAPIIFTYHTKYDIDIRRAVKVKRIADEGIRAMVGNIEACDELWAVSRGAGESLKALGYQGDFLVMKNGVDFARGRADTALIEKAVAGYDLPEGIPVFLFVGRMMAYKGIPLILDAMKILDESGMDFRLVLIGKGPDMEMLKEKARFNGLMGEDGRKPKVLFIGPVYDRDVLRAWNTRADLFLFPSTFDTNGLVVREAAACGLASVLIRDSCAAEGITDGRNGFLIEENAESMAALLLQTGNDLSHLYDVGSHAMDEIYLSWQSCVSEAFDRYQTVLERKKAGMLPEKKKLMLGHLVSMTARSMDEQTKLSHLGYEMFLNFKEAAIGMMDNVLEVEDAGEQFWENISRRAGRISDRFDETLSAFAGKMDAGLDKATASMDRGIDKAVEKIDEAMNELAGRADAGKQEIRRAGKELKDRFKEWKESTETCD